MPLWKYFFTFEGRIDRARYFITGTFLLALKYFTDALIAARFLVPWHVWSYFLPPRPLTSTAFGQDVHKLYFILWAVAIPFFWTGISFTVRRLRDSGHRIGWLFLFFLPVANLFFFLYLSLAPTAAQSERSLSAEQDAEAATPSFGTPLLGVLVAAFLGLLLVLFSANLLAQYAWGLFLGVPFVVGFVASWLFNSATLHSRAQTISVAVLALLVIGLALIGLRLEGMVCLAMALPLAVPFAIAGALAARRIPQAGPPRLPRPGTTASIAILPLLMFVEHAARLEPPVRPVVTSITIAAPAATVWRNVIAFPPLAPPRELLFRSGIAYPIGATISGTGVGAVRRCRFSTGDFVEPIITWDENHLLAFNVTEQPPSLQEFGLGEATTPHIARNYMRSQHGQFRLIAVDATHTVLEGTTWYQDYFWPQLYWRGLSDAIVHRIHLRVLTHIKAQAETQQTLTASR